MQYGRFCAHVLGPCCPEAEGQAVEDAQSSVRTNFRDVRLILGKKNGPPLIWRVYPVECAQSHKTPHMDTGARLMERAHRRKAKLVVEFRNERSDKCWWKFAEVDMCLARLLMRCGVFRTVMHSCGPLFGPICSFPSDGSDSREFYFCVTHPPTPEERWCRGGINTVQWPRGKQNLFPP